MQALAKEPSNAIYSCAYSLAKRLIISTFCHNSSRILVSSGVISIMNGSIIIIGTLKSVLIFSRRDLKLFSNSSLVVSIPLE